MSSFALILAPDISAPGEARDALRIFIDDVCPGAFISDAELMTSELVSNSVSHAHAGDVISLSGDLSAKRLRVEVGDAGSGFEPSDVMLRSTNARSGWGLRIVDQLSDRWGSTKDPATAWFELDR